MFLDIILIPKKILLLTIVVLAVLAIQFYSMSDEKLFTVYADNTSSYLSNYDNNNVINSGIKVDSYPVGVAVNPTTNKIYVANEFSNTVSIVDGSTDKIEATVQVGSFPYSIDVNPLNNRVYVTNRGSDSVSVIDGSTNLKITDVSVGKSPVGIAVNPSLSLAYVTNIESGTVSVIDGITNTISSTIKVGNIPYGIAVNPTTNRTYITNIGDGTISVIDNSAIISNNNSSNDNSNKIARTSFGKNGGIVAPTGIAINTSTNRAYVTDYASNTVFVIDLNTNINNVIGRIKVGDNPVGISINPISNKIYVANIGDNTVSIINGSDLNRNQPIKNNNNNITVNPLLKTSFNKNNNLLARIPVNIKFPLVASFTAVNSATNKIYVTNTASNTISVIDGNKDAVLVKLNFHTNPPNAGEIVCNGVRSLGTNSALYTKGEMLQCVANPHRTFNFDSWSGIVNSLSNPLTVQISQFGSTLTANFDPTFPPETYLFIGLGIAGSIPVFIGWYNKNRQKRHLNIFLSRTESIYDRFFQNRNYSKQEYITELEHIRREILGLFRRGKISDAYYNILDKKTTDYISLGLNNPDNKDNNS
jgi:YVTN family beta-propeller protein